MTKSFPHGYAVVVGVGADLPVTVSDAEAIYDILIEDTRCAYCESKVRLLTDKEATRKNILNGLEWLASVSGEEDTVIIYFSGHGVEAPDFHLVPFGFDWKNLKKTAISSSEFTNQLRLIKAQKLVVLLDCCHAGGQAEAKSFSKSPLPANIMNELRQGTGRVVIASSRKDELSWTGTPYSQFTMAVIEALTGQGAFEKDGFARILDLALWIGRKVPERTNDKQHPILKISDLKDNFAIAWYAGGQCTPKALPWTNSLHQVTHASALSSQNVKIILENYRQNLLLIEERISQYIDFTDIPLQLLRNKQLTETKIREIENQI